jgi:hypothetical protein
MSTLSIDLLTKRVLVASLLTAGESISGEAFGSLELHLGTV